MNTLAKLLKNSKIQIIVLLILLVVWSIFTESIQSKLLVLLYAVAAAVFAEFIFFAHVKPTMLQSAIITGLIIGTLAAPFGSFLFIWLAAVLAIAAKRFIKFNKNKHIFNPAAFGLIVSSLVFSSQINWWGNSSSILIIIIGGTILFRLNRLSLPFAYFIFRFLSALALGTSFTNALLLPNLFFAFIMLVEPKTSPAKRMEQWFFGGICGILATLSYICYASFEGDLIALLIVNILRPLLQKFVKSNFFNNYSNSIKKRILLLPSKNSQG